MKYLVIATLLVSATLVSAASVGRVMEIPAPPAEAVMGLTLIALTMVRRSRA